MSAKNAGKDAAGHGENLHQTLLEGGAADALFSDAERFFAMGPRRWLFEDKLVTVTPAGDFDDPAKSLTFQTTNPEDPRQSRGLIATFGLGDMQIRPMLPAKGVLEPGLQDRQSDEQMLIRFAKQYMQHRPRPLDYFTPGQLPRADRTDNPYQPPAEPLPDWAELSLRYIELGDIIKAGGTAAAYGSQEQAEHFSIGRVRENMKERLRLLATTQLPDFGNDACEDMQLLLDWVRENRLDISFSFDGENGAVRVGGPEYDPINLLDRFRPAILAALTSEMGDWAAGQGGNGDLRFKAGDPPFLRAEAIEEDWDYERDIDLESLEGVGLELPEPPAEPMAPVV